MKVTKLNEYVRYSVTELQFLEGIALVIRERFDGHELEPQLKLIRQELARQSAEKVESTSRANKHARIGL